MCADDIHRCTERLSFEKGFFMKNIMILTLLFAVMFTLTGVAQAQTTETIAPQPEAEQAALPAMPAMLDEMAKQLEEGTMTPEMMQQMAQQMRQMRAGMRQTAPQAAMPQMPGNSAMGMPMMGMMKGMPMMGMMKGMPMMGMMKGMPMMGMMSNAMQTTDTMEQSAQAMPMQPMRGMLPMMGAGQDPKQMSVMYQMYGEMMKAQADIMMKYGQQLTEEPVAEEGSVQE